MLGKLYYRGLGMILSKKHTLSAIATLALVASPLAAFAQDTQVNSQNSKNSAAAVGTNNTVIQNTEQTSIQDQVDVNKYRQGAGGGGLQINQQNSDNSAAAVGNNNAVIQNTQQQNLQLQERIRNRMKK
jgi:hypothetical protein